MRIWNQDFRVRKSGEPGWGFEPQRGSATIATVAIVLVVGLIFTVTAAIASSMRDRAHAQGAADLAALAAATEWAYVGDVDPCARAGTVAAKNSATLTKCEIHGASVEVTIEIKTRTLHGFTSATARAGPREQW